MNARAQKVVVMKKMSIYHSQMAQLYLEMAQVHLVILLEPGEDVVPVGREDRCVRMCWYMYVYMHALYVQRRRH